MGIMAIVPLALVTINSMVAQDNTTTDLGSTFGNESGYPYDGTSNVTIPSGNATITVDNTTSTQ